VVGASVVEVDALVELVAAVVLGLVEGPLGSPPRTPPMLAVVTLRLPAPVVALVISCSVVDVEVTASSAPSDRRPSRITTVAMAAAAITPTTE